MEDNINYEIYTENILEKAKDKSFDLQDSDDIEKYIFGKGVNPSCGDMGHMYVLLEKNEHGDSIIKNIKLKKEGCAISVAGMNMLSEKLIGQNLDNFKNIVPGDIYSMLGIRISPSRAGCALLCYNAFEDFLKKI